MPHWASHRAPSPDPSHRKYVNPTCEPIFVTTMYWPPRYRNNVNGQLEQVTYGGEYIITWYLGRVVEDAIRETGTGMPDEAGYEACLLSFEEAYQRVPSSERQVLVYAWRVYMETLQYNGQLQAAQAEAGTGDEAGATTGTEGQTPSTEYEGDAQGQKDAKGGRAGEQPADGEASVEESCL